MQEKNNTILDKYIEEIRQENVLTSEEECALAERIREGDRKALDKLVTANLRFVVSMANKYKGRGLSTEDLISEGNMALIKAAANFDASHSRFVSYAAPIVRHYMEQAIEIHGEHYPTPQGTGQGEGENRSHTMSVDAPLGGRENVSLLDLLANHNASAANASSNDYLQDAHIRRALERLSERERTVVAGFYGVGQDKCTLAEIASLMGIKRERARQIRDAAVRKLSRMLKGDLGND